MTMRSTIGWSVAWVVLLLGLLMVGCGTKSGADATIELTIQEEPTPPRIGPATIRFRLTDKRTDQPVTNAKIQVESNMMHPGMAPSRSEATEVAPGDYQARIDYTMRGDWYLLFDIRLPDGQTLTRQVNVDGVIE